MVWTSICVSPRRGPPIPCRPRVLCCFWSAWGSGECVPASVRSAWRSARRRRFLCQSNHLCMLQLPQTRWWVSGGESSGYNSTRVQSSSSLFVVASATRGCDRRRRTGVAATGRPGGRSTKEGEDRGRGRVRSSPRQLYGRRRREGRGVDLSLGFCRRLRVTAHLLCSIRLCHFCFDLVGSVFVQSVSQERRARR